MVPATMIVMGEGSEAGPLHQAAHDFFGGEIFLRNFLGGAAMAFIVLLDGVQRRQNVLRRLKTKETFAAGQEFAEARFLGDDRPAGGQVTRAAVAEPAGIGTDILVARHGEFTARLLDVGAVAIGVSGNSDGIGLPPAMLV